MIARLAIGVLALCISFGAISRVMADENSKLNLKPLEEQIKKLVQKHYPKATFAHVDGEFRFAFNTRKFMMHEALLTGEWQDAFEELGPQKGGIMGDIVLVEGQYGGMAVVPQTFDKRYFTVSLLAPYSKKLDHHLMVHLMCPRDVPKDFAKDFDRLVNEFEKFVTAGK